MTGSAKLITGVLLAAHLLLIAALHTAAAATLDQYRAQGIIAERFDGFAEVRAGQSSAEASRLVAEVNAKRREIYRQRAASQRVPVEEVGKVYASEIASQAPRGTYFRTPDGTDLRK